MYKVLSPMLTKRGHRRIPSVRPNAGWTVDRLLGHAPMWSRVVDEPTFMMLLDLELERARRHRRGFSLTNFEVDHTAGNDTDLVALVAAEIRSCDVATFVDDHLIALWSESLPAEADTAIDRIVAAGQGLLTLSSSVSFPRDALTRTSLLSKAMSPSVVNSNED